MLLGIVKIDKDSFVARTLEGKYIKVNNFILSENVKAGMCMELDLDGLDYIQIDSID